MITKDQLNLFAKKNKTNETVVFREYLQLLFLNALYITAGSEKIYFKGGTAIHLILKSPRFSEDLDFTVELEESDFINLISKVFEKLSKEENISFKERKTITGKRFLLTAAPPFIDYKAFVHLDFSFREKVITPEKSIIKSDFPILFTSYIYHLSAEELLAEKIRAILTREKGRDLYDLWYLLTRNTPLNEKMIVKKLEYYQINKFEREKILKRVGSFSEKDFILDLKPFVSFDEREKLGKFLAYLKDYLSKNL